MFVALKVQPVRRSSWAKQAEAFDKLSIGILASTQGTDCRDENLYLKADMASVFERRSRSASFSKLRDLHVQISGSGECFGILTDVGL